MHLTLDKGDLQPIVEAAVEAVLSRQEQHNAKFKGQIGYTEVQAAAALGVERHVLRDARLRGEIHARKLGKRYVYSAEALRMFLSDTQ